MLKASEELIISALWWKRFCFGRGWRVWKKGCVQLLVARTAAKMQTWVRCNMIHGTWNGTKSRCEGNQHSLPSRIFQYLTSVEVNHRSVPTFVIPFRNDGRRIVLFSNWIDRDIFSNFNTNKSSALSYHTYYQFRVGYCSTYYIQYSEVQAQSVLWCFGLGSTPTSPLLSGTWYSEGFLLVTNVKCTSSGYCCYSALHNHEKSNLKKRILLVCLQPATEVQVLRRVRSPEYCAPSCKYWPTRYHR